MTVEPEVGLSKQTVYDGKLFKVVKEEVRLPDGNVRPREIVVHPGAVALIMLDDDGRLLLVRQYRRATGTVLLEVPAGTRVEGETAEECARREGREETGYEAAAVERLGGFYSTPGFTTEYLDCYLMTGLSESPLTPDDDENLELVRMSQDEALGAIASGEICDAKSICGILLWARRPRAAGK